MFAESTTKAAAQDLSGLSREALEEELAAQAAHIDAGLCRLVELAAECERRLDWAADGTTFASWLAWRCSLPSRVAREHERIGRRLAELPLIHAAFERGELSYAKVSLLTPIAEPDSEEKLLELAQVLTASQLERAVAVYRRLSREQAAKQQEREFLNYFWDDDGSLSLRARLAAEEGALFVRALDAAREAVHERRREAAPETGAELSRPAEPPVSNAEALAAVAQLALGTDDRPSGERFQVVVHVDADTLAREADGRCELDDGRPLAAETMRRLTCDGSVVELLEREGETLSLGRKRRTVSPAQRRALRSRDRCCRFPGCERTRFVDAHHVRHWSCGGETSLDNLILLCRRHHRLVHERGYTVELDDRREPRFRNEHGIAIENVPRPPPSARDALRVGNGRAGLEIDGGTCRNGTGERMDLTMAVEALLAAAR